MKMSKDLLVIIDYGSGNLRSAAKAFEKIVFDQALDVEVRITNKPDDVQNAGHIVLPGQGAFHDCMAGLESVEGMIEALEQAVLKQGTPFLGICVGMQLLASRGLEGGITSGLGWIEGEVKPLLLEDPALKIPHMGWNSLYMPGSAEQDNKHFVLKSLKQDSDVYFVHSYEFECSDLNHVLAYTDYEHPVTAVVGRDNIIGMQFHPEKSHINGLKLLSDFVEWRP